MSVCSNGSAACGELPWEVIHMRRALIALTVAAGFALGAGPALATGQPNQSCQQQPNTPGRSSSAPGSAFNPNGTAGSHYAGQQPQNSKNPNSVSQYDVACRNVSR
jgi:hypothetical protein